MTTLEEAWAWYKDTRLILRLMLRLGKRYWNDLPWDGVLARDEHFKTIEGPTVEEKATSSLGHLDDLAVVVLFSVFEATVRRALVMEVSQEIPGLRHVVLRSAAGKALEAVKKGNIQEVLGHYKTDFDKDLIEEVNQVRDYRNWVAHGRSGQEPPMVEPEVAYQRLQKFLEATGLSERRRELDPADRTESPGV
jgi:hypothetical protein